MVADVEVGLVEAALEADEPDVAAPGAGRCLAAGGRGDLQAADAGQELADPRVAAEVVLIAPEVDGLARAAGDHPGVDLAGAGGHEEDAAGAIADEVPHLDAVGTDEVFELPELPA